MSIFEAVIICCVMGVFMLIAFWLGTQQNNNTPKETIKEKIDNKELEKRKKLKKLEIERKAKDLQEDLRRIDNYNG